MFGTYRENDSKFSRLLSCTVSRSEDHHLRIHALYRHNDRSLERNTPSDSEHTHHNHSEIRKDHNQNILEHRYRPGKSTREDYKEKQHKQRGRAVRGFQNTDDEQLILNVFSKFRMMVFIADL